MGRVIVVYGGGFQPFHEGHLSSYLEAKKAFPKADFYVVASADVKQRPIPFEDKRFLATQAGVSPTDFRDVAVKNPLNPTEILSHYNPEQDIYILVRSERDPVPYTRKDGSPAYYQPFVKGGKFAPFSQHGYVFVTKKHDFKLLGQDVYSGTQVRNMYSQANDQQRQQMVSEMYPRSKKQKTIKKLLDKYIGARAMNESIINLIKQARPLLKEANNEQKLRMLKIIKEAMKKDPCWSGYKQIGMKDKGGKQVPNCVPTESVQESTSTLSKYDIATSFNTIKPEIFTRFGEDYVLDLIDKCIQNKPNAHQFEIMADVLAHLTNSIKTGKMNEDKKLSTAEKLNRNLKKGGFDSDASLQRIKDIEAKYKKPEEPKKSEQVTEDSIRPNLVKALSGLGFKGPFKLGQLPAWMKELQDARFDENTPIMIGGDDPEYDPWVAKGYDYGYAYGIETGYQTGLSAQQVFKQAQADMQHIQGVAEEKSKAIAQTAKDLTNPPKVMQHRAKRDQEREEQYKNAQLKRTDESQDYLEEK